MKILGSIISTLKNMGTRIVKSNNRSLATVFGCLSGMIVGVIYVLDDSANLAIIGKPDSISKMIIAVLLAIGTGGNLSSYIGATIDILTGEKTIIYLKAALLKKNSKMRQELLKTLKRMYRLGHP